MRRPLHLGPDLLLGERHWAAGMSVNVAPIFGPRQDTFGHSGWGGAFGCANRDLRLGIGYVMNRMGSRIVGNPRGAALAAAIFQVTSET